MKTTFSTIALLAALAACSLPCAAQLAFAPQVTYVAGNAPEATALGDFDKDGDLDAAVTSDAPDKVTIHRNGGQGTFILVQTVQLSGAPHSIGAADLDQDGDLDLAVTLHNVDAVAILRNTNGVFSSTGAAMAVGSQPRSLVAADIDGDADIDLVTSNRGSDTLSLLRNAGNATFLAAIAIPVGSDPRHVAAADLDGDGDRDLCIANNGSNNVTVLANGGTGSFTPVVVLSTGPYDPEGIVVADLDGDHDLDLAASAHDASAGLNAVLVARGSGGLSFSGFTSYAILGQDPGFVAASDLDLDGDLDLATANRDTNNVSVLANTGLAAFGSPIVRAVGASPEHVVAADLDGDQVPDLVVANGGATSISILQNLVPNGTLTLLAPAAIGTSPPMHVSSPGDAGDFFVTLFSFGTSPGYTVADGRHVQVNDDPLLAISLTPGNQYFINGSGWLGVNGTASMSIVIPPMPQLVGTSIYASCVVLNPSASIGLEQSFGPLQITLQ
jgi:hypothetical protein